MALSGPTRSSRAAPTTHSTGDLASAVRVAGVRNCGCRNTARSSRPMSPSTANCVASATTVGSSVPAGRAKRDHTRDAMNRAHAGLAHAALITSSPCSRPLAVSTVFGPSS
jgi:hypothetical protein